jgi:hypothetical protein
MRILQSETLVVSHKTLRVTPEMEAGVSDHVWSLEEMSDLAHNRLIGVLLTLTLYCLFFLRIVKSGLRPGPNDPQKMLDRVIRVGGGVILLIFMLLAAYFATQRHKP